MNCSSRPTENRHANGIRLAEEKKKRHLFGPCSSVKNERLFLLPGLHNKWEEQARFERKKNGTEQQINVPLSTYILTTAQKNITGRLIILISMLVLKKLLKTLFNLNVVNYSTVRTRRKTCFSVQGDFETRGAYES